MALFRYVGDQERMVAGPPVLVLSPGDIVEAESNPDPLLFRVLDTSATGAAVGTVGGDA